MNFSLGWDRNPSLSRCRQEFHPSTTITIGMTPPPRKQPYYYNCLLSQTTSPRQFPENGPNLKVQAFPSEDSPYSHSLVFSVCPLSCNLLSPFLYSCLLFRDSDSPTCCFPWLSTHLFWLSPSTFLNKFAKSCPSYVKSFLTFPRAASPILSSSCSTPPSAPGGSPYGGGGTGSTGCCLRTHTVSPSGFSLHAWSIRVGYNLALWGTSKGAVGVIAVCCWQLTSSCFFTSFLFSLSALFLASANHVRAVSSPSVLASLPCPHKPYLFI